MKATTVLAVRGFSFNEFIEAAAENALIKSAPDNKGVKSDIPKKNLEKNATIENGKM